MSRTILALGLLSGVTTPACYSPNNPVGDGDASADNETTTGATTSSVSDPTATGLDTGSTTQATGPGGTGASTGSEATGFETSDAGSTSDNGGQLCGNGEVDAGEDCDDANDINADGCNIDCVTSGAVLWTVDFAEDFDLPEFPQGGIFELEHVAVAPGGTIAVIGRILSDGKDAVLVRQLDADATITWTSVIESAEDDHHFHATGLDATDDLVVTCGYDGVGSGSAFVRAFSSDGEGAWAVDSNVSSTGAFDCIILPDGDVMVVSNEVQDTTLRRYDGDDGSLLWSDGDDTSPAFSLSRRSDALVTVASSDPAAITRFTENGVLVSTLPLAGISVRRVTTGPDEAEFVAVAGEAMLFRRYDGNALTWSHAAPATGYGAIAVDSVGAVTVAGTANEDIWVQKLSPEADEIWTASYAGNGGDYDVATSVAVGPDDSVFVAGTEVTTDGRRGWLRKYAP